MLLVVGVQISIYRHPVLRVLQEKDEEIWGVVIRLGDCRVDALSHLAFRLNGQSWWSVDLKDGFRGLRSQLAVLTHAVQRPFTHEDPMIVREWISFVYSFIDALGSPFSAIEAAS